MVKNDGGTLTLGGANTYSGGSTLNGGTTIVTSTGNLGSVTGAATINAARFVIIVKGISPLMRLAQIRSVPTTHTPMITER